MPFAVGDVVTLQRGAVVLVTQLREAKGVVIGGYGITQNRGKDDRRLRNRIDGHFGGPEDRMFTAKQVVHCVKRGG